MAQKAEPAYQSMLQRIRAAPSLTADKTGWKWRRTCGGWECFAVRR